MTMLLVFNEFESLTVQGILDKTQIEGELSLEVLAGLLKNKVLASPQIQADQLNENFKDSDIKSDYVIEVNQSFER